MPSWNIHTAHVERLIAGRNPKDLGIEDVNSFLFGNYVPDIYVGFMVSETTYRIDYCMTHVADPNVIPVPDADKFWDVYVCRRRKLSPAGLSLVLGAWAHLVADRFYNGRFRTFYQSHDMPQGEELRIRKQGDFDLFGRSLDISSRVVATPELLVAARDFRPYSILPDDVARSIAAADAIVCEAEKGAAGRAYQLLDEQWMTATFDACNERLITWLETWRSLEQSGRKASSVEVREEAGLPPATTPFSAAAL